MPPTSVLSDGRSAAWWPKPRAHRAVGRRHGPAASVDLRLGSSFRVFHNHRIAAIDLADRRTNLTELVEVADDEVVRHPPRRVRPQAHPRARRAADDLVARIEARARLAVSASSSTPPPASSIRASRGR
jgi:hypothetical protein